MIKLNNKLKIYLVICFILIIFYSFLFKFNIVVNASTNTINWNEIKKETEKKLKKEPENTIENFKLAISLANLGQIKESYKIINNLEKNVSVQEFNEKIDLHIKKIEQKKNNKNEILILNYNAFRAIILKNYKPAIQKLNKLCKLEPQNIWLKNYIAASHIELGQLTKAEKLLKNILEIKENNFSHLLYGVIYYKRGQYINAIKHLHESGDLFKMIIN